jgi:hypothetical protein
MKSLSSNAELRKILAIALIIALILGTGFTSMADEPLNEPLDDVCQELIDTIDIVDTIGAFDPIIDDDIYDCDDVDCEDCDPWLCDYCGEGMMTCLCCAACYDGCELCDPSLYDCEECGICFACIGDDESFIPPVEATSTDINIASTSMDVANSADFDIALAGVADGTISIINITASFTYTNRIVLDGVTLELNLGANTLTIKCDHDFSYTPTFPPNLDFGASLFIHSGASLSVIGTGTLNVVATGFTYINPRLTPFRPNTAIHIDRGIISNNGTIISATATNNDGAALSVDDGTAILTGKNEFNGSIDARNAANVNVSGNVAGGIGIFPGAKGTPVMTVNGNVGGWVQFYDDDEDNYATVTINGNVGGGVVAENEGTVVTVHGNVGGNVFCFHGSSVTIHGNSGTVNAWGGTVTVNGNVTGIDVYGVSVGSDGMVTVNGDITLIGLRSISIGVVFIGERGNVTVNGNIIVTGLGSIGVSFQCVSNSNSITVNGTISAAVYIQTTFFPDKHSLPYITVFAEDQYDTIVQRGGRSYRQFITDLGNVFILTGPIHTDSLNESDVNAAISTGEPLVLEEGADTTISEEALQAIKDSEGTLTIVLPNGREITIRSEDISDNPKSIDLNFDVVITSRATPVYGVNVPANSVVIIPEASGEFGFTFSFTISAAELAAAGLNGNTVGLFHISSAGVITNRANQQLRRNSDGSVTLSLSSASRYVLSSTPPIRTGGAPQMGDERTLIFSIIAIALGSIGIIGWTIYVSKIKRTSK